MILNRNPIVFISLFLSIGAWAFEPPAWSVVIDPGHGGHDKGAQVGSLKESDLVLKIALKIDEKLRQTDVRSFLTRGSDQAVELSQRMALAEKNNAQLFVSIHANSNPFSSVRGVEFYLQEQKLGPTENIKAIEKNSKKHQPLEISQETLLNILNDLTSTSQNLQSLNFTKTLKQQWQATDTEEVQKVSIKTAPFYVLTNSKIPSVLIEVGYMSSPAEMALLQSESHQDKIAEKIKNSIIGYQKTRQDLNKKSK